MKKVLLFSLMLLIGVAVTGVQSNAPPGVGYEIAIEQADWVTPEVSVKTNQVVEVVMNPETIEGDIVRCRTVQLTSEVNDNFYVIDYLFGVVDATVDECTNRGGIVR